MKIKNSKKSAIRLIKEKPYKVGLPKIQIEGNFPIELITDKEYFFETDSEIVFFINHAHLNDAVIASIDLFFEQEVTIKYIISDDEYLFFNQVGNSIHFELEISKLIGPSRTLSIHTLMRRAGQTLRLEHNHVGRKAGIYMDEKYPEIQIKAVMHYMFAVREIISHSGIGEKIQADETGHLLVLGFETNNPTHPDYPPHWHLINRWPYRAGSQAPHIYVDEDGKNTHNRVSIDMIPKVGYTYEPGEWCDYKDYIGRKQLSLRITEDGGFEVLIGDSILYFVSPYKDDGVTIYLNNNKMKHLKVSDDSENGDLTIISSVNSSFNNQVVEVIKYDPLTGQNLTLE